MRNRNMFQVKILFGNIPNYRLKENIYKSLRINIDFDTFYAIYKDATSKKYGFLLFDERNPTFTMIQDGYDK